MKRTLILSSLVVLALVAVAVAATDLSGTWVLDKAKSDVPMGRGGQPGQPQDITLVIKQAGNDLAITTKRGEQSMDAKYTLDGKESKNPAGRGGEAVSKATAAGDTIVIETTADMGRGPMTTKAVYALSEGGKVLTVTTTRNDRDSKQVFAKQ
jgi:hypothetical protein